MSEESKKIMTLDHLAVGESCLIRQVGNQRGAVKRRLVDMGITPGTVVKLVKIAPMGDPLEVSLRGYELSLRREDAAQITAEPLTQAQAAKAQVPEESYQLHNNCYGDCAA